MFFTSSVKVITAQKRTAYSRQITAIYLGFTASAEVVTAKKRKPAYRPKIPAVWYYRPKITAIFDTAYKSTAMSEWSEGMALRLPVGIRSDNWDSNSRGDFFFSAFFYF